MTEQATPELKREIKELIIEALNISDVKPEDIKDDASLFQSDNVLELDSVDALEIVVALQKKYGARIDDSTTSRHVLTSVDTIAEFVAKEQATKEK